MHHFRKKLPLKKFNFHMIDNGYFALSRRSKIMKVLSLGWQEKNKLKILNQIFEKSFVHRQNSTTQRERQTDRQTDRHTEG